MLSWHEFFFLKFHPEVACYINLGQPLLR